MDAQSTSRNLLQRFAEISPVSGDPPPTAALELSLGLSLGGCFSSNPREKSNFLIRSASISSFPNLISSIVKGDDDEKKDSVILGAVTAAQLKRTCSMPVPGAEDYRKRKVLQTLKRLEAKRKRNEKRISGGVGGNGGLPPLSLGSCGCSNSSGGRPMQGAASSPVLAGPVSFRTVGSGSPGPSSTICTGEDLIKTNETGFENTSKKPERRGSGTSELEMPCVSTIGSGPNGKRVEGFLYKYCKGEEVRIVCVCHGNFLTPAEFVRHAGGGDVDHPMRHIVVNTPAFPFL